MYVYASLSLTILITNTDKLQELLIFLFVYKEEKKTSDVLKLKENTSKE